MKRLAVVAAIGSFVLPGLARAQDTLTATVTATQTAALPLPAFGFDYRTATAGLGDPRFWGALLITLLAGAIGGVVYELLILQGNIELPHKPSGEELKTQWEYALGANCYDLGIWARVIFGALAAVAALLVLAPSTAFALLATAIVAGSAGTSIFRSIQDRLLASLAMKEAADTRTAARLQDAKVEEALKAVAELRDKVPSLPGGRVTIADAAGAQHQVDLAELDRIEALLLEARGVHDAMEATANP